MLTKFFDLQVNGYAGVDFNQDDLTVDDLQQACAKLKQDGVQGILATIITADMSQMINRLQRIVRIREQNPLPYLKTVLQGECHK